MLKINMSSIDLICYIGMLDRVIILICYIDTLLIYRPLLLSIRVELTSTLLLYTVDRTCYIDMLYNYACYIDMLYIDPLIFYRRSVQRIRVKPTSTWLTITC